jgi:hypothetical protein
MSKAGYRQQRSDRPAELSVSQTDQAVQSVSDNLAICGAQQQRTRIRSNSLPPVKHITVD